MLDYRPLFVERLGEHDLQLLAELDDVSATVGDLRRRLAKEPEAVESYLADPQLFALLYEGTTEDVIRVLSPSFAFAVLVHKTIRDLDSISYVPEWVGAGERLPVFDVASLRDFIEDTSRRYVIIELLNSFTRVASGLIWVRTPRGYRRRRYSELDPLSLAEMVAGLPAERRAAGYRRLGDVALFLTGVFPDHTARHPLSATRRARLTKSTGVDADWDIAVDYLRFLEEVGSRWYDRAADAPFMSSAGQRTLQDLATHFTEARRFLNYLADRYLHHYEAGLMNPVG